MDLTLLQNCCNYYNSKHFLDIENIDAGPMNVNVRKKEVSSNKYERSNTGVQRKV